MFTGTPQELRDREAEALVLAQQIADTLTRTDALGLGLTSGSVRTPAGAIRNTPGHGWTVNDR